MTFHVLTIFPDMIEAATNYSILQRAKKSGIVRINAIDIRRFAENKHGQIDDAPYGGGAGMVMMAKPARDAYLHAGASPASPVVYLSPSGKVFDQGLAREMSLLPEITLLCGHYEGLDQRAIDEFVTHEISVGDFVLTGGEVAALVVIDAVSRLLPGAIGKEESHVNESFSEGLCGLLEHPHYTRPQVCFGREVPEVLLSGHHEKIRLWRKEMALKKTLEARPELLAGLSEPTAGAQNPRFFSTM